MSVINVTLGVSEDGGDYVFCRGHVDLNEFTAAVPEDLRTEQPVHAYQIDLNEGGWRQVSSGLEEGAYPVTLITT